MEETRGTDFSGSGPLNTTNSSYCPDLSAEVVKSMKITLICVSSTASVASILAIIFILVSKRFKKFVHRLTLYLMVAILLVEAMSILDAVPVHHNGTTVAVRKGFEGLCAASGFLYQVVFWMELLVICWIVLYLLGILVFRCNVTAVEWKQEACGLAVVTILPFLFNWIPFVKDMYGISGPYCWIKQSMNSNCKYDDVGLTLMFLLLNGPEFFVGTVVFLSLAVIAAVMCRNVMGQQGTSQPSIHQQGLKEVLPLLLYPVVYLVLWAAVTAFRIYEIILSVQDRNPSYSLQLVFNVLSDVRTLLIPLICLLHLSTMCFRKKQNRQSTLSTTTSYIIPNEFTDQEDDPLIIRGSGTKILSKDYKSVFEGSEQ